MGEKVKRLHEINELLKEYKRKLSSINQLAKDRADEHFNLSNGCLKCGGRGWVVIWDTLDCMHGSYAEYGDCPQEGCTYDSRKLSGRSTRSSKYDRNRGTTWKAEYTADELSKIKDIEEKIRATEMDIYNEETKWSLREGVIVKIVKKSSGPKSQRVPLGIEGLVSKVFHNNWGTKKLIIVDKHGQKWWPHASRVEVIDPEPDTSHWDELSKRERFENGYPIIATIKAISRSGKAALVKSTTSKEVWVPLSQVPELQDAIPGQTLSIMLPLWIAANNGFVTNG